jgi:integrase
MSIERRTTQRGTVYDVRLRDPGGRAYMRTFATLRRAQQFERGERATMDRGAWTDPREASTTLAVWSRGWLERDATKRLRTKIADGQILEGHVLPELGHRELGSVTPLDIQRLVAPWAFPYKPNTVRRYYAVVRAVFAAAVTADVLVRSPCRGVKLPRAEPSPHHVVAPDELDRLATEVGSAYRPMVLLAAVTGLRFSECAGLRVRSLDLLHGLLTVTEGVVEAGGRVVIGPPKSAAARRCIAIAPALAALLAEHLARRGLTAADAAAWVFPGPKGGPLRYANFHDRVWVPACTRAGLEGLGFHDLRRTAATVLVTSGVDVRTAQHRLGHSDPRLTLAVYAQVAPHADRAAAAAIEDHFLAGARDERAMDGDGVLLTGAARRLPPAQAVEPERGFEPLTCSLRVSCSTD